VSQFLKENGLLKSLQALQEESQVTSNTVDDVDRFAQDIIDGRWDQVLGVTSTLRLPTTKLIDLFEQIVLELAELRELDTARAILRNTPAMGVLKKEAPDRYLRLEHILQRSYFDYGEAYPGGSNKDRKRQQIAAALKKEVFVAPPSRLMGLLTQSLKWQQFNGILPKGSKYDLFRGAAPTEVLEDEKFPTTISNVIKFGKKSHSESACFSPDGHYLVSGSDDGFIEVWDFDTGKLCKDLKSVHTLFLYLDIPSCPHPPSFFLCVLFSYPFLASSSLFPPPPLPSLRFRKRRIVARDFSHPG
jgi:WD40 repeat-containing protein SMU1